MQIIQYPNRHEWPDFLERPALESGGLRKKVAKILSKVKKKGDEAILKYNSKFDGVAIDELRVTEEEIEAAISEVPEPLKQAILQASNNIRSFHRYQLQQPEWVVTQPGIICSRKMVPIEKVGLYIPAGSAPLFSTVLMLGIPAAIAGCKEIVLCSPAGKDGKIYPAILFTARLVGITSIFKVGGAQAIAAMAYGTRSIPKVQKIFGPGNQYVTQAKQLVQEEGVAIDLPAGPTEVCILADETANVSFVVADLLSQAEHGSDSQVILVTNSPALVENIEEEIDKQIEKLPRKSIAAEALVGSKIVLVKDLEEGIGIVNEYAPEHLIIACKDDEGLSSKIINAGSVFLGHYSPESAGDYASGTNHTLPTNGFARAYSGVSVDSFVKKITYQRLSKEGLENIADTVITMAEAEGLSAHAEAIRIRLGR